jgi:hypothetical protein
MERIGLKDKQMINYSEFFSYFRDGPEPNYMSQFDLNISLVEIKEK